MQHRRGSWLLAGCLGLAGCGAEPETDAPKEDDTGSSAAQAGPCVSFYADSDEVADRGRLVQLDVTLRYQASRSERAGGGDASMALDAQSHVQGTASQLACAWDTGDGGVRYELVRPDEDAPPFASTHDGSAQLTGSRVTQADGATLREEVDVSGPLEALHVVDLGPWQGPGVEACVILSFDAPLRGRSLMHVTGPGVQREEPMDPSGLVLDGYSALSPKTYESGDHRFVDQSFAICTAEEASPGQYGPPGGLTISDDGLLWQRSGQWRHHPSAPVEQRMVDFTLRVVPPRLQQE